MRWLLLLASVLGFGIVFSTRSPGMLAIGLLLGFGFLFFALFAFAAARIEQTSRPDAAMLSDSDISKLKASLRKPDAAAPKQIPPPR